MQGEIEIDESYFGAKRVRGKRGRGAGKKTPVFGMLKRNGCVYTQVAKNSLLMNYCLYCVILAI